METCSNDQTFCKSEPTSSCASLLLFAGNSSYGGSLEVPSHSMGSLQRAPGFNMFLIVLFSALLSKGLCVCHQEKSEGLGGTKFFCQLLY